MTPLLLFLLAGAVTYVGTVSAAFNALMRLSLRIHAERTERDDVLGWYLEDPRRLFVPSRVLIGSLTIVAAALLARVTGLTSVGLPILILSIVTIVIACEHVIPLMVVRSDPERVLDLLLPSFDALTRVLRPAIDTYQVHGRQLTLCREVAALCAQLGESPREVRARNLLNAFLPSGFTDITPARLLERFGALWERFGLSRASAPAP